MNFEVYDTKLNGNLTLLVLSFTVTLVVVAFERHDENERSCCLLTTHSLRLDEGQRIPHMSGFFEVQDPSGACIFSPLLLVGEGMDPAHVRAPGEVRTGIPVVVARHLIVSCYVRCGVASRRQGVVMLDIDAVFCA
jgi:hypothetical protein